MTIHPDDQVLDYMIYQKKIGRAIEGVDLFFTGYAFWLAQMRKK